MIRSILVAAVLSMSCATASSAMSDPAMSETVKVGASALASKIGIQPSYVEMALTAAKAAMGSGATPAAAAQQGVDKAANQAQADGKPMTADQKSGLLNGLADLLK